MTPIVTPRRFADQADRPPRLRILYGHARRILVIDRCDPENIPVISANVAADIGMDGVLVFPYPVDLESEPITAELEPDNADLAAKTSARAELIGAADNALATFGHVRHVSMVRLRRAVREVKALTGGDPESTPAGADVEPDPSGTDVEPDPSGPNPSTAIRSPVYRGLIDVEATARNLIATFDPAGVAPGSPAAGLRNALDHLTDVRKWST